MRHVSGYKNAPKTDRALPGLVVNVCFNKLCEKKILHLSLLFQCCGARNSSLLLFRHLLSIFPVVAEVEGEY